MDSSAPIPSNNTKFIIIGIISIVCCCCLLIFSSLFGDIAQSSAPVNNGTKLVYHDGCDKHTFKRMSNGAIQYKNGKCIHPEGGSTDPAANTNLVLWDGCDKHFLTLERKLSYKLIYLVSFN